MAIKGSEVEVGSVKAVAVAGRRVDAPDSDLSRFALADVARVADRIERKLRVLSPVVVVASGAAGADLLALRAAYSLGARTIMILPFDATRFERASVADRPGDWPKLFAEMLAVSEVEVIAATFDKDDDAYGAVTEELLARAIALGGADGTAAMVIWDGASRGASDQTARFAARARELGLSVEAVLTK